MREQIYAVVAEILGVDRSEITDSFGTTSELWDSLAHIRIVAECESRCGVTIPFDRIVAIETVADLIAVVEGNQ